MSIKDSVSKILKTIPSNVEIVAATKSRNISEIKSAIDAGIKIIGENYVQEAREKYNALKRLASFHLIGHLQTNKVKSAVEIFDMIQTIDSLKIAREVDKITKKPMPVLIEVNIAHEKNKTGIIPEDLINFLISISSLKNLNVKGLMTMCAEMKNPDEYRPYFRKMKHLFEEIKNKKIQKISMEILSMGMSDNFSIAIAEGSNMVRLGRILFDV